MPFSAEPLAIPEVILVKSRLFSDQRGFFMETYKASEFAALGIGSAFVQDNHSLSQKGVLRGLHYQLRPRSQGKLVRVVRGEIFDVAVDIRKGSPHFGKWVAARLTSLGKEMLWIPEGFAHAFVALEDGTEVLYKTTEEYAPSLDRGILWNDPRIGIEWPLKDPVLSEKDAHFPLLKDAENNFVYGEDP